MLRRTRFSEPSYLNAGSSLSLVRCWLQTVGLLSWRSVAWRDRIDTMAISTGCRGDSDPLKRRLCTRIDIVKSFDPVIRNPAYCRMADRGRHGGMTGRSALTVLSVLIFDFLDYSRAVSDQVDT